MKKCMLVSVVLLCLVYGGNAQTEKGTILLGGNVSLNSSDGHTSFIAAPNIGVFVTDHLAVGARASLFTSEGFTSWSIGPFGRYYFGKNDKGKPFVGLNFGIGGADGSDAQFEYGISAGYAVFLNRSIALEFAINYDRSDDFDQVGLGAGFQIHFKK